MSSQIQFEQPEIAGRFLNFRSGQFPVSRVTVYNLSPIYTTCGVVVWYLVAAGNITEGTNRVSQIGLIVLNYYSQIKYNKALSLTILHLYLKVLTILRHVRLPRNSAVFDIYRVILEICPDPRRK